jgi:hypothetical protein
MARDGVAQSLGAVALMRRAGFATPIIGGFSGKAANAKGRRIVATA